MSESVDIDSGWDETSEASSDSEGDSEESLAETVWVSTLVLLLRPC